MRARNFVALPSLSLPDNILKRLTAVLLVVCSFGFAGGIRGVRKFEFRSEFKQSITQADVAITLIEGALGDRRVNECYRLITTVTKCYAALSRQKPWNRTTECKL